MKFPLGAMSVGDVLDRGLKVLFNRLGAFLAINLIIQAPALLLQLIIALAAEADSAAAAGILIGGSFLSLLAALVLQSIGTGAILYIIVQEYIGEHVTVGQALGYALGRFLPLLGASIIYGLVVFVGTLLCIAPGIYFAVTYLFATQVVGMESLGPIAAMNRSQQLVDGHRWRVLGVVVLLFVCIIGAGLVVGQIEQVLPSQELVRTRDGFQIKLHLTNYLIHQLLAVAINVVLGTYYSICCTLLYLDLRIRKEGFDLEVAARQQGGNPPPEGPPLAEAVDQP